MSEGKLLAGRRALYGYVWNDPIEKAYYVINEEHGKIVVRIFRMALSGMSLRKIAFTLTEEGIPTPDGKTLWRYQSVRNILTNPFYIGRAIAYRTKTEFVAGEGNHTTFRPPEEWVEVPDAVPALIDEETFYAVQDQLVRNKKNSPRNNPHPEDTLLRCGMAICGSCGHNLGVDRGRSRNKPRIRYRCPRAHAGYDECPGAPDITAAILDAFVWKEAIRIIRNPGELQENLDKQKTEDPTKDELTVIDNVLMDTATRIRNITETIETTPPSEGRMLLLQRLDELGEKKKSFEEKRDIVLRQKINWADEQIALDEFKAWCAEKRDVLTTGEVSYAEKRNALERLGVIVTVYPSTVKDRIQIDTHPSGLRPSLGWKLFPSTYSRQRFLAPLQQTLVRC